MRAAATIVGNKDFNVITPEPEKTSGMSSKKASARNQRRQTILPGGKTAGDTWRGGPGNGSYAVLIEAKEHVLLDEWLDAFDVRKRAHQRVI